MPPMTERQVKFEEWWNCRHPEHIWALVKDRKGQYIYIHAEFAWQAWQEAFPNHHQPTPDASPKGDSE